MDKHQVSSRMAAYLKLFVLGKMTYKEGWSHHGRIAGKKDASYMERGRLCCSLRKSEK